MSEIGGVAHLGYVPRDEVSSATVAVAGKDQRFTAKRIDRAIRTGNLDTANDVIATGIEGGNGSVDDKWNCNIVCRLTQPIDQLDTGTARQAVHPSRRMAGIVEVMHDGKWKAVAIRQPFDSRTRFPSNNIDDCRISVPLRLVLNIKGKQCGTIFDTQRLLKTRAARWDQAGR